MKRELEPQQEVWLDGMKYKIGRHNLVFFRNEGEWIKSERTAEELKSLYRRGKTGMQ